MIIHREKPFDPGPGWSIWRGPPTGVGCKVWRSPGIRGGLEGEEEQDTRSLMIIEPDLSRLAFENCLKQGESLISGEDKLKRHIALGHLRLDAQFGQCLLEEEGWGTLEWIFRTFGVRQFELAGTTLRSVSGRRAFIVLFRDSDPHGAPRWRKTFEWTEFARSPRAPSAIFLPY